MGHALAPVAPRHRREEFWGVWTLPRSDPLPAGSALDLLSIGYPERELRVAGWNVHWLAAFFVLTLLLGFVLKRPLGVEL